MDEVVIIIINFNGQGGLDGAGIVEVLVDFLVVFGAFGFGGCDLLDGNFFTKHVNVDINIILGG